MWKEGLEQFLSGKPPEKNAYTTLIGCLNPQQIFLVHKSYTKRNTRGKLHSSDMSQATLCLGLLFCTPGEEESTDLFYTLPTLPFIHPTLTIYPSTFLPLQFTLRPPSGRTDGRPHRLAPNLVHPGRWASWYCFRMFSPHLCVI